MIILLVLFYLILLILIISLFFISIPYNYILSYNYQEKFNYRFAIKTFFFSFAYQKQDEKESTYFKIFNYKKEFTNKPKEALEKQIEDKVVEKIKKAKEAHTEKEKKKDKKKKFDFPIKLINMENLKHVAYFIKDILKMIIPNHLRLYFLIGMEEPHLNGWILAYYYSLKGVYPGLPINIDVNWEEEDFESNGELGGKIIPIQVLIRILVFIFSVKTFKIGWQTYKFYKKK